MSVTIRTKPCCGNRVRDFCFKHDGLPPLPEPATIIMRFYLPSGIVNSLETHGVRVTKEKEEKKTAEPGFKNAHPPSSKIWDELGEGLKILAKRWGATINKFRPKPIPQEASRQTESPPSKTEEAAEEVGLYPIPAVSSKMLSESLKKEGWVVTNPHINSDKTVFTFVLLKNSNYVISREVKRYVLWLQCQVWKMATLRVGKQSKNSDQWRYIITLNGLNDCPGFGRELVLKKGQITVIDD